MDQGALGMVGTTFRRAGQAGLAYYTLPGPAGQAKLAACQGDAPPASGSRALHVACGFAESVYLATCNRVEVFFVANGPVSVAEYRRRVHAYFTDLHGDAASAPFADARQLTAYADEGAVERLFVVACALDSMVPGEAQILGQVKAALASARAEGSTGGTLEHLFAQAFRVAKRVREDTNLGRGRTSMVSLAVELLHERLGENAGGRGRLAIVGAGAMAEQCGRALGHGGAELLFVNRTLARAERLAQQYGGSALSLAEFLRKPPGFVAMLTSTASPQPLFDGPFLRRLPRDVVLVDLSVQRDVELGAASALGLSLWDIDRLQARASGVRAARHGEVAAGRALVDEALDDYRAQQTERSLGQALRRWRGDDAALLHRAMAQLAPKLVAAGADAEALQPQLMRWARTLLASAAHGPTHGLKRVAHLCGQHAVQAFVDGARFGAEVGEADVGGALAALAAPTATQLAAEAVANTSLGAPRPQAAPASVPRLAPNPTSPEAHTELAAATSPPATQGES